MPSSALASLTHPLRPPEAPLAKPPQRPTVLVVCTANVCRSPRAEFALREAFARVPEFASILVASVGTEAARAEHLCEVVRESGDDGGLSRHSWLEFADRHRSAPLTAAKVASAKLILTAGREHRAAVAKIDPAARSRTFTLKEALWLGEGFTASESGDAAIDQFARYAHRGRGMREIPEGRRSLIPWKRSATDALTITDTHGDEVRRHRATTAEVTDVAGRLAGLLTGGAPGPR